MEERKPSEAVEEALAEPKEVGNLAKAKVVSHLSPPLLLLLVSLKCIYLFVAPRPFLTITVKSPSCTPNFWPKRWLLAIMFCDDLNVALAFLYCSFDTIPKCIGTALLLGNIIL